MKWKRSLVVVALVVLVSTLKAQPPDPSTLPLLQQSDLVLVGGNTLPGADANGRRFGYGARVMALAPDGQSLYLGNGGYSVAQITLPTPVLSNSVKALPRATYIAPFRQVMTDALLAQIGTVKGDTFVGLYPYQGRFIASAINYYDANNTQLRCHLAFAGLDFDAPQGWSQVGESRRCGYVAGSMTPIPPEWQAALGGTTLAIPAAMPIISRTSLGPAASVVDPARIGQPVVPAIPLLYYDGTHATLGPWNGSNPTFGGTTQIGGGVIVPGARTMLFLGSNGMGPHCYGDGTDDKAAADRSLTDELCWDTTDHNKGSHAPPYRYQIWAYDLNDLAAVKAGRKKPWEPKPYGVWPLNLPVNHHCQVQINSVAIDPATGRILFAQLKGESTPDCNGQAIVWTLTTRGGSVTPPVVTPPVVVPPVVIPPSPTEVEMLKAEVAKLQAAIAIERAAVAKLNLDLAAAVAAGTKTTADLTAMRTERDAALTRLAEKDALLKQALAK